MTYANDKDETHSLSCPFVTRDFTRGAMPMKVACTHCTTILNVKSPLEHPERSRKKRERRSRGT
jgi:hypothetical protein